MTTNNDEQSETPASDAEAPKRRESVGCSGWAGDAAPQAREQRCPVCLGQRVTHAMRCGVKWEIECGKCKGTGVIAASPTVRTQPRDMDDVPCLTHLDPMTLEKQKRWRKEHSCSVVGFALLVDQAPLTTADFLIRKPNCSRVIAPFITARLPGQEFHIARGLVKRVRTTTTKDRAPAIKLGQALVTAFHNKPGVKVK